MNHLAVILFDAFASWQRELACIEAELTQHRGVNVGGIVTVFNGVKTDFVGRPDNERFLEQTATPQVGQPDGRPVYGNPRHPPG